MIRPRSGRRWPLMLQAEGGHPYSTFRRAVVRFAGPGLVMVLVGAAAVSTGLLVGRSLATIGCWPAPALVRRRNPRTLPGAPL